MLIQLIKLEWGILPPEPLQNPESLPLHVSERVSLVVMCSKHNFLIKTHI